MIRSILAHAVAAFVAFGSLTTTAQAEFSTGWNQAWIMEKYGTQWVGGFDANEFAEVLDLAKNSGATRVRFWLFEGFVSDALIWQGEAARGVNPAFLQNLRSVIRMARDRNLKLNLTLFDGNMSQVTPPSQASKNYWWNLFNDLSGERDLFLEQVFRPLLGVISEPGLAGTVDQLDLMNEIDAPTKGRGQVRFENGWVNANNMVCEFFNFKQASGLGWETQFTASVGWGGAENLILNSQPWPACVDFYDLHVYGSGSIPRARELVTFASRQGKKIQLGEFGQSSSSESDSTQTSVTRAFIVAAKNAGFSSAMPWRLKGSANGEKFLYQKGDRIRPAYYEFQRVTAETASN